MTSATLHRNIKTGACLTVVGFAVFLTLLSRGMITGFGFHYDTANDNMPTAIWLGAHVAIGAFVYWVWRKKIALSARMIIGVAILARLILLPSIPIHENDFYRYLWDGKSIAVGVNPYEFEPGALDIRHQELTEPRPDTQFPAIIWKGRPFSALENERLDRLAAIREAAPVDFERIGHPAVPTIYPPVAQFIFWIVAVVFGGNLLGLKVVLLLFEIGILALVAGLVSRFRLPPISLALYAWNPLVLKEFANSAHYDAVPIFFILLAVWLATGQQQRVIAVALALAAATLAKFFAILIVPILLSPKVARSWLGYVVWVIACFAAWLPFALWDGVGFARVFEGLQIYNAVWEANSLVFPLLNRGVGFDTAKLLLAATLILFIAYLTFVKPAAGGLSKIHHTFLVFGALFVLSPTAFPWYFCWVLPFLCLFPKIPWLLLALLLPIAYYADFHSAADYPWAWWTIAGINWLLWLVWGTFFALLLEPVFLQKRQIREHSR